MRPLKKLAGEIDLQENLYMHLQRWSAMHISPSFFRQINVGFVHWNDKCVMYSFSFAVVEPNHYKMPIIIFLSVAAKNSYFRVICSEMVRIKLSYHVNTIQQYNKQ